MADELGVPFPVEPPEPAPFKPTFPEPPVAPSPTPTPEPPPEPAPPPEPEPTFPGTVPELGIIAGLLVLLGLIAIASALADFLNWLTRFILGPFYRRAGSPQTDTKTLLQPLSHALGTWEQTVDGELAVMFHELAGMTSRVGRAILAAEETTYAVAVKLAQLEGHSAIASRKAAVQAAQTRTAERQAAIADAQLRIRVQELEERQGASEKRVATVEHNVTHLIEPELDTLRHKIPALERGAAVLWDGFTSHEELLGLGAMTATVAAALGKMGASWIRCESNGEVGRKLCRTDSDLLRKLLGGALDVLGIVELCTMLGAITRAGKSSIVTGALGAFSQGLGALLKCTGATRPTPLKIPAPDTPPIMAYGSPPSSNV